VSAVEDQEPVEASRRALPTQRSACARGERRAVGAIAAAPPAAREGAPGAARRDPAERRQHEPIVRPETRPTGLPAENRRLVPEHQDVELLRTITPGKQQQQRKQPADDEVHQRDKQTAASKGPETTVATAL
jgi:hypothetical protein